MSYPTWLAVGQQSAKARKEGNEAYAVHAFDQVNQEMLESTGQVMGTTVQVLVAAITPIREAMLQIVQTTYLAAGQPFDPDDDGMWRWARQQATLSAAQERAEQERSWQATHEELRRRREAREAAGDEP